ncbi:Ecdysteroid 22-kinase [Operophtera brumata]|uniref:Ecdysteroid 22-kinase n=1 Tax=Operophtera brumata TaxID=104452 RepID=A0A0L7LN80_OPEBR|nr:Ecdysteroid 22-kinase [Operophtera brumata]
MAGLKIEGNLDNVSEPQLGYIKAVIEKRGFKDAKVVIEPVGKAGDNYVANVKRITVEGINGGSLKMIAKVAPNLEALRLVANTQLMFRNEHIMYTKVLPKFEQLQKAADVPTEERLRFAACYGSFEEAPNEVILLEDLKESGFEMLDRFKSLSNECVRSVLKNFAILHSLSYALKQKEPQVFEDFKNSFFDMWANVATQEETKQYFDQLESSALMILENDIHKKAIKGVVSGSMNMQAKQSKINSNSKHSADNKPQSIMIDYQISKVSSPVCDIHYMVFNCTDYQTRKEHYIDWIDYYHDELDKNLSIFGLKANYVYPRDQLDADLKRHGKMSLGQGVVLGSTLIRKTEDAAKLKEAMESADLDEMMKTANTENLDPETLALFKTKIEGLIDSHLELGFI